MRREDPNFVPPNFAHASSAKRVREAEESEVRAKRERAGDEDGEEMDIDDDDEAGPPAPSTSNSMSYIFTVISYGVILQPFCPTCPFSASAAFQQVIMFEPPTGGYQWRPRGVIPTVRGDVSMYSTVHSKRTFRCRGFQTAQVKPSAKPNAAGEKVKTAEVVFENAQLAAVARQMLDGFQLKKDWNMAVNFLP